MAAARYAGCAPLSVKNAGGYHAVRLRGTSAAELGDTWRPRLAAPADVLDFRVERSSHQPERGAIQMANVPVGLSTETIYAAKGNIGFPGTSAQLTAAQTFAVSDLNNHFADETGSGITVSAVTIIPARV